MTKLATLIAIVTITCTANISNAAITELNPVKLCPVQQNADACVDNYDITQFSFPTLDGLHDSVRNRIEAEDQTFQLPHYRISPHRNMLELHA